MSDKKIADHLPRILVELADLVEQNKLSSTSAKTVLGLSYQNPSQDVESIARRENLMQISDDGKVDELIERIIANNSGTVDQYMNGDIKVFGFLVGQIMKESKGQANPVLTGKLLRMKLEYLKQKLGS